MRIYVRVNPRSAKNEIIPISEGEYRVKVTAVPEKGMANKAVRETLAGYFGVPKKSVSIVGGRTARTKIVDIENYNLDENSE